MQYHRDGFQPGDPDVHPAAPGHRLPGSPLPEAVDVLIAGSGPAGLCLAAQLARYPSISTLLVEPKLAPMEKGQADGISVRSMEMFQAFGFAERVARESVWINETTFWTPAEAAAGGGLQRAARVQDVPEGISEMPHVLINQARVHDMFLDVMRQSPTRLVPDHGYKVQHLVVDPQASAYPVTVTLAHTRPGEEGRTTTVRANHVVGCDGARSAVRTAIGGQLHGDAAHQAWGVIDLLAVTNFPDWRMKSFVRSAEAGTLMVLPREGGHLVRLYVEMDQLGEDERVAQRGLQDSDIIAKAQRILAPFTLDVKEVVWWSIYEIGHRLTDTFDDVPAGAPPGRTPRVLLAGDACHTHSPKAGQGMNVSMGDTFNLGWKLALVLQGKAPASLLHSYSGERRAAAKALVDFDHQWARVVGAKAGQDGAGTGGDGGDRVGVGGGAGGGVGGGSGGEAAADGLPPVARAFVRNLPFTCGLTVHYPPSALTGAATHQHLATGFPVGMRLHSAPVLRLADARPMQLGHCIEADARFRLFIFAPAGDHGTAGGPVARLCTWLQHAAASPLRRHTAPGEDSDAVIDTRAIFQPDLHALDFGALPPLLRPPVGRYGLCDYEKAFCADTRADTRPGLGGTQDIFDLRGIDRAQGCLLVVRPDQHVGHLLPLAAQDALAAYFAGILAVRG